MSIKHCQLFPTILILLMVIAAVPYFMAGDWRKGIYWLCAAGLNAAVTF